MSLSNLKNQLLQKNIQIVHVVAKDRQNCIGKNNELAWHIPEDLKHFKTITTGGVVVMGRKTFESIGKPLPNRTNWVITRDTTWTADGVKVAHSLEQVLELAGDDCTDGKLFIIGGGEIYRQSIDMADILEITEVDLDIKGDAFYPPIPSDFTEVWRSEPKMDDKSGVGFGFVRYQKKR